MLKALAEEGRTIIVTVHQAPSNLFRIFDNILLLARGGSVAYSGPRDSLLAYFEQRDECVCPHTVNPADFALDLITVDLQHEEHEVTSRERVNKIVSAWAMTQEKAPTTPFTAAIATPAELSIYKREMNPWHLVLALVVHRAALSIRRDPNIIAARTTQVLGIGIVITLWFAPLKSNYESIQSRMVGISPLVVICVRQAGVLTIVQGLIQEFTAIYSVGEDRFSPVDY